MSATMEGTMSNPAPNMVVISRTGKYNTEHSGNIKFNAIVDKHGNQYRLLQGNREGRKRIVNQMQAEMADEGLFFVEWKDGEWVNVGKSKSRGHFTTKLKNWIISKINSKTNNKQQHAEAKNLLKSVETVETHPNNTKGPNCNAASIRGSNIQDDGMAGLGPIRNKLQAASSTDSIVANPDETGYGWMPHQITQQSDKIAGAAKAALPKNPTANAFGNSYFTGLSFAGMATARQQHLLCSTDGVSVMSANSSATNARQQRTPSNANAVGSAGIGNTTTINAAGIDSEMQQVSTKETAGDAVNGMGFGSAAALQQNQQHASGPLEGRATGNPAAAGANGELHQQKRHGSQEGNEQTNKRSKTTSTTDTSSVAAPAAPAAATAVVPNTVVSNDNAEVAIDANGAPKYRVDLLVIKQEAELLQQVTKDYYEAKNRRREQIRAMAAQQNEFHGNLQAFKIALADQRKLDEDEDRAYKELVKHIEDRHSGMMIRLVPVQGEEHTTDG